MIARVSRDRQVRLLPVCRWRRCRSVATDRLGALCEKHLREALALKPEPCSWCGAWACGCDPDTGRRLLL